MTGAHVIRIVSYHSENADAGKEWAAYLVEASGDYLPVRFQGPTEAAAILAAQAEWDRHKAAREETIRRREESRRKAEERKSRKAAA